MSSDNEVNLAEKFKLHVQILQIASSLPRLDTLRLEVGDKRVAQFLYIFLYILVSGKPWFLPYPITNAVDMFIEVTKERDDLKELRYELGKLVMATLYTRLKETKRKLFVRPGVRRRLF